MCFREHVLDFQTRINVPLRNLALFHFFNPLIRQALPFTYTFRNFKSQPCIHSCLVNQKQHNIVTTTDYRFNVACSILNQILRISQPYACSMGQS
ncbi:hypothetical protein D3C76_1458260 [compost metagenome]